MNDINKFWRLNEEMTKAEKQKKQAEKTLKEVYPELVQLCPHPEAVQKTVTSGPIRICKVCGLEDHFLIDMDPGDEYNYGHAGKADEEMWANTVVEQVDTDKELWSYRKTHIFQVKNGKAQTAW